MDVWCGRRIEEYDRARDDHRRAAALPGPPPPSKYRELDDCSILTPLPRCRPDADTVHAEALANGQPGILLPSAELTPARSPDHPANVAVREAQRIRFGQVGNLGLRFCSHGRCRAAAVAERRYVWQVAGMRDHAAQRRAFHGCLGSVAGPG